MADTDTNAAEQKPADGDNAAQKPAEKTYTKTEHTAKIKEVELTLTRERDALKARLDEIEAERVKAEEAKLSATQRAELDRKREQEKTAAQIKALETAAATERAKRHEVLKRGKAASLAASMATQVWTPDMLPHVERAIAERLVVDVDASGNETLSLRMGAEGDNEPADAAWTKFRDAELRAFLKVASGSGAQHGGGGVGGAPRKYANIHEALTDKFNRR